MRLVPIKINVIYVIGVTIIAAQRISLYHPPTNDDFTRPCWYAWQSSNDHTLTLSHFRALCFMNEYTQHFCSAYFFLSFFCSFRYHFVMYSAPITIQIVIIYQFKWWIKLGSGIFVYGLTAIEINPHSSEMLHYFVLTFALCIGK